MSIYMEQMTGPGYFPGRAYKCYLQADLSFGHSTALKKNDQSMFVLRHHGRLPAPSASLVQKVGQRVFVFPCVTGELHYYGLIFFHAEGKMKIC